MHFPIVLLLGLLDRQFLLRMPSIMEAVVSLLAIITRPLSSLASEKLEPKNVTAPASSAIIEADSSAAVSHQAAPDAAAVSNEGSSQAPGIFSISYIMFVYFIYLFAA